MNLQSETQYRTELVAAQSMRREQEQRCGPWFVRAKPGGCACPVWCGRAQLERFQHSPCPSKGRCGQCCPPCPGCRQSRAAASLPLFQHKGEQSRALNLASWARACPKPALPETLAREAACPTYGWNMLCSSHPRLAYGLPSSTASWAPIYTGPENQGPSHSPWCSLLLCFTDFGSAASQSFPFSLAGILSGRRTGISFTITLCLVGKEEPGIWWE